MLELALGMSFFTVVLFLFLVVAYCFKWRKIKAVISPIMSIIAIIAMSLFYYVQKVSGNPDQGMEFWQLYFPISVYLFFVITGIVSFITTYRQTSI